MSARNARFLLIAAFAISLLLHALLAFNVHRRGTETQAQVEVVRIEHRSSLVHRAATPPPPSPSPPPKRTPPPRTAASAPTKAATRPVVAGTKPSRVAAAASTPAPTPVPTPVATLAANPCGRNDTDAAVVVKPTPPVIPVSARADGTSGTAVVKVQLDVKGAVVSAAVLRTSGNPALDVIAVGMARDARYAPALHDCKPVAAAYEFNVRFAAW